MTCPRCADLAEQLAYYKGELGLSQDATALHRVRQRFGLTAVEAALTLAFYRAKGRVLLSGFLENEVLRSSEDRHNSLLPCHISHLRAKLGPDAIATAEGADRAMSGYAMTVVGLSKVMAALVPADLPRAGENCG